VAAVQLMPGGDSRYIIMILPFTLLAFATYFNDGRNLRLGFGMILLLTISVSIYRLAWWDSIYFNNNTAYVNIRTKISEPYVLVSETPKYSYYIFGKSSSNIKDINNECQYIVVYGSDEYNKKMLNLLQGKINIDNIEILDDKIIAAISRDAKYHTIIITAKGSVNPAP